MGTRKTAEELLDRLAGIPVVDTHEHMRLEAEFVSSALDFASLMSYVGLDLGLAGFPAGPWGAAQFAVNRGASVEEKWRRIAPHWPFVRTSSYGRAYRRVLRIFFGVDDLDDSSVHEVSERISEYQYEGVYDEYIHGRYGIRVMLQVQRHGPTPEPRHFATVLAERVDRGLCDVDEAEQTARWLFHDNAWGVFRFENWQGNGA